jgi:hypothetical protein
MGLTFYQARHPSATYLKCQACISLQKLDFFNSTVGGALCNAAENPQIIQRQANLFPTVYDIITWNYKILISMNLKYNFCVSTMFQFGLQIQILMAMTKNC